VNMCQAAQSHHARVSRFLSAAKAITPIPSSQALEPPSGTSLVGAARRVFAVNARPRKTGRIKAAR
jgi:hypothetical protein